MYITGYTASDDFPQQFPTSTGGGEGDVFIARYYFNGELLRLDFSTLLGGTDRDVGRGIVADGHGHAYVTGYTYSGDFPTTPGEPPAGNTNGDVIVSRITFTPSTKYYYADGQLIAFQRFDYSQGNGLRYVFRDHLGSTNIIVNGGGVKLWEDRYYPFGDIRYTWKKREDFPTQTDYRFTGQRLDAGVGARAVDGLDRGLYFYNARYYDPTLARFIQPDTLVPNPGDPQSLNRYSYTRNNPVRYTDPSGHRYIECGPDGSECSGPVYQGGGGPASPPPPTALPWGWPTSTPSPTPGPQLMSPYTSTPGPFWGPATPLPTMTPTATLYPQMELDEPGSINWTALY